MRARVNVVNGQFVALNEQGNSEQRFTDLRRVVSYAAVAGISFRGMKKLAVPR